MAIGRESSTGGQDRDEKKDHHEQDPPYRERGGDENRFLDPQDMQARGHRSAHSQPGGKGDTTSDAERSADSYGVKQDNTRPGGNRSKGDHHGKGHHDHGSADHD